MNQPTPSYSFDVTAADFQKLVVDASHEQPVLVDFWAEWCAPCKVILPILEKITESYQGELLLAKVNCDVEHALVQHFGIQSLPIVVLEI
ncbi:MAG: thioredoxin family protein, partial [Pseudomonas helleri]